MPELTDLQKATLSGQVAISINTCQALRRYDPNFDMRKCLEARKIDHKGRVGRNHSRNGEYVNLAMDFLDEKYNSAMNQQIAGKQRIRSTRRTRKRSTKKRNTARHTRKGR
jgi:hypothetical protein